MPWPIVLYDTREEARVAGHGQVRPGAMWPAPWVLARDSQCLSPHYWALPEPRRVPLVVKLPDLTEFVIDGVYWNPEQGFHGDGWTVEGIPPQLTLAPSINIVGSYHGYIANGIIGDDVDGRVLLP